MEKKRICFVQLYHITEQGGGAEVQANYLAQELSQRGFDVHYICQSVNYENWGKTIFVESIKVHWIKNRANFSSISIQEIYDLLEIIKPDVVIERMSSAFGASIIKYKLKNDAKYIWICTDNNAPQPYRNVRNSFEKLNLIKFIYSLYASIKTDRIRQKAIALSDVAFSQNEIQKKLIGKYFKKNTLTMISGHPSSDNHTPSEERFKKKTILWAANWGKHKRPELFVELARTMQGSEYNFIMLGGHSDKIYMGNLLKNKPNNLISTGQLSFENALAYFDTASLFVNTSAPGGDGFPNTFIQSWLRGVPVVTFGFDPDHIIEKNALGFNASNLLKGKDFINKLLTNPQEYELYSKRVISYALENHSIKRMTDNFISQLENEGVTLYK